MVASVDPNGWRFEHLFTAQLPADPIGPDEPVRPRQVHGAAYSRVRPTPVAAPQTLAVADEVAELLGMSPEYTHSREFAEVMSGNQIPAGADPHAACYGGHQFGNWAGQLGDGRAISYGEVVDALGGHQALQLKGAGLTPYSRGADGRAVLRSSVREFLCSEAMFHLGVPTTRALSLVATGDQVVRDMFYDGHPAPEPGAIVCRVAPSFVRFGSFQLPASRGDVELLRQLTEFTIATEYPNLTSPQEMFVEVVERTAALVVEWMRVGFVHGVLNTDNMSILGLTIDYGPYGWLEDFDPNWTPNTTDAGGRRYRYGAQPQVAAWNLAKLANALLALDGPEPDVSPYQQALDHFAERYQSGYLEMMAARLGWGALRGADEQLIDAFIELMTATEVDYLILCRKLADVPVHDDAGVDELLAPLMEAFYRPEQITDEIRSRYVAWIQMWAHRSRTSGLSEIERQKAIRSLTPKYVLRNYLAHEAILRAEQGDPLGITELLDVLRDPYGEQPGRERFAAKRPEWARTTPGCSMLSCSS
jgi:serine/tyrosine/threonine adenylyltransferase